MSKASWRLARTQVLLGGLLLTATQALSHGYVQQPMARQQFCERDGGYWWPADGSAMPNAACRAAFLEAGTFQFVQNIEYAANVQDYKNIAAVKAVVRDGTLCAGADNAKRGMNLPHANWQRTVVTPRVDNSIEVLFFASTPHNPSFWEFYLTKPGFDGASRRLSWADLDLIDSARNVATETIDGRRMYRFNVRLPGGRTGDAILFTRWQRQDPGGEGFYNCSDITIADDTGPLTWYDKGAYVRGGTTAEAQDEAWFRVFDSTGRELVFEKLAINASNQAVDVWAAQLASAVNARHSGTVQIGVRNSDGSISYSTGNTASNRVWLIGENDTFALDIKKPQPNQPPTISLNPQYQINAGSALTITASAIDPEGQPLTYAWTLPAGLTSSDTSRASIVINPASPAQTTDYSVNLRVSDGVNTAVATTTVRVVVGGSDDLPECASRTQLSNGCQISNLSMNVTAGSHWIILQVPAGARNLVISTSGGTGNADVYVSAISWPTPSSYQFRSVNAGNSESITVEIPTAGWYYVNVYAVAPYSGVTVRSTLQ
jgi:predicted carbohydrate-binding protein with CBM5 and CBM33 domain